jgi:hypothetical protein
MMYFGLPIAPMEDIHKELSLAVGMEEEVPLYNIKPPMHFLTAHDRRNWGKDSLKGKLTTIPLQIFRYTTNKIKLRKPSVGPSRFHGQANRF